MGGYIGLYGSVNTFKNKAVGQGYTQFQLGGGGGGGGGAVAKEFQFTYH